MIGVTGESRASAIIVVIIVVIIAVNVILVVVVVVIVARVATIATSILKTDEITHQFSEATYGDCEESGRSSVRGGEKGSWHFLV